MHSSSKYDMFIFNFLVPKFNISLWAISNSKYIKKITLNIFIKHTDFRNIATPSQSYGKRHRFIPGRNFSGFVPVFSKKVAPLRLAV